MLERNRHFGRSEAIHQGLLAKVKELADRYNAALANLAAGPRRDFIEVKHYPMAVIVDGWDRVPELTPEMLALLDTRIAYHREQQQIERLTTELLPEMQELDRWQEWVVDWT